MTIPYKQILQEQEENTDFEETFYNPIPNKEYEDEDLSTIDKGS